ncbi:hypothetical protein [Microbacterium sp.]|uniref:hypothetical protein n=1 Tax=Microbacterium sp. TaxID=51671 RepID=UPI0039E55874
MADKRNATRHAALAESVALVLRLHGHDDARPTPRTPRRKLSETFAAPQTTPAPDILGVPEGWYVDVTSADPGRWGPSLDSTRRAAGIAGAHRGVLVAYRNSKPISKAYAVMTLADLADLIAEAST